MMDLSCYFIFVAEADGTAVEKDFISKLKLLSNAVGKKFVLIITEDSIRSRFDLKSPDKKSKKKGESKVTRSGSMKLPEQGVHEFVGNIIEQIVVEYLHSLNETNHTDPLLSDTHKKVSTKIKKSLDQVETKIDLENVLDDKPSLAPDLFVVLVGFTDPQLILEFQTRNLPLKCILKVQEERPFTSKSRNNALQPFWETISHLTRLRFVNFFMRSIHISNSLLDNLNYIYDTLCCVLYDIVDIVQEHAKYTENCNVYPLNYIKIENTAIYDKLMSDIPLECINVEYVLYCIIEQVIDFDESHNSFVEENKKDSVISIPSLPFMRNTSLNNGLEEEMHELLSQTVSLELYKSNPNYPNAEEQLPFVLQKINDNSKYLSRTFHYRDRLARTYFHLDNFPELYLTLSQIINFSIKHLEKIPNDLPVREKSFLTFHVNRLLKHVKSKLSFVTQRQMKYYLELIFFLICMNENFTQVGKMSDSSNITETHFYGTACLKTVNEKYEQLSNVEESVTNDRIETQGTSTTDTDINNEINCAPEELWNMYITRQNQQLEELRKLLILIQFQPLLDFFEIKKPSNNFSLVNIQVEHLDSHILAQVIHEERFLHKNYELRYFSPTDSFFVIFFSPTSHYECWSSSGIIPEFMSIQTFFNFKVSKPKNQSEKEIATANIFSKSLIDKEIVMNDPPNYAYDIGDSAESLKQSEFFFNENGLIIKVQKFTLDTGNFMFVVLQSDNVYFSLCGYPIEANIENNLHDEYDMSSMNSQYCLDNAMKFVLTDTTVVTISKCASANLDSQFFNNLKDSEFKTRTFKYTMNFSITLPTGLIVESYQLNDDTVIRQKFLQDLKNESWRYYFKNGKVLINDGKDQYRVYHRNGDEIYCAGIKKYQKSYEEGHKRSPRNPSTLNEQNSNVRNKNIESDNENPLKKHHKDIDVIESLDALGNFKRFERGELIEHYSKYSYKYTCNLFSGELYLSRENGLELYILDTLENNTMITKFKNSLTFTSEYNVRADEEYVSNIDEVVTFSELNINIEGNDENNLVENEENSNHSFMSKYSNVGIFDGFVIIDQTWKVEEKYFAPIMFTSDGNFEIHLRDLNIYYQNDRLQVISDGFKINALVDSVELKSIGKDGLENQVIFDWSSISDEIIQANISGGSSFNLNSNGIPTVNKFDGSVSSNASPLNNSKCFVINRDCSGYEFVNTSEVIKQEKIQKNFLTIRYTLPNCKDLFQTNIQRTVEPICDKFRFDPVSINPISIKRSDLKFSQENSSGWLFPDYADGCNDCYDLPLKLRRTPAMNHVSIEFLKFEQIIPDDVDILKILRSAFEDYTNEATSICDQFKLEDRIGSRSSDVHTSII